MEENFDPTPTEEIESKELEGVSTNLPAIDSPKFNQFVDGITSSFKVDVDYGVIPGCKKPTLYIAGADKLAMSFNLVPRWRKDSDTLEMVAGLKNVVAYVCELVDRRTNKVVGEGRGAAQLGEKDNCKTINSTIKMAEIHAKRDAILNTFPLRDRFTQDMGEDDAPSVKKTVTVDLGKDSVL